MSKFRKKPVVIAAVQWFRHGDNSLVAKFGSPYGACQNCGQSHDSHGWIPTLEGWHIVCPNDWIITGVKGEMYPCKPDIFAATYEPVDDES